MVNTEHSFGIYLQFIYTLFISCLQNFYIIFIFQIKKGEDYVTNLISEYEFSSGKYILVSDEVAESGIPSKWKVYHNPNSDTPFELLQADYENETYNLYGEYRTFDKVMKTINGVKDNNTVSALLSLVQGTNVILQFGNDVSFDTVTYADEKVDQINFTSPTETTFIMSKQSIPTGGE